MNKPSSWVAFRNGPPQPRLRLFCFHFAGGSAAAFRGWRLPGIEVCGIELPGRATRFGETPYRRIEPLVRDLRAALVPHLDLPFAFFGHSLGGVVTYFLTRALHEAGGPLPMAMFISATMPRERKTKPPVYLLPHDALLARLREYGGTPREILEDAELMELLAPVVRADFEVSETYETNLAPVPVDLVVLAGDRDNQAPPADVETWRAATSKRFDMHVLAGDHFFLRPQEPAILELVGAKLTHSGEK